MSFLSLTVKKKIYVTLNTWKLTSSAVARGTLPWKLDKHLCKSIYNFILEKMTLQMPREKV